MGAKQGLGNSETSPLHFSIGILRFQQTPANLDNSAACQLVLNEALHQVCRVGVHTGRALIQTDQRGPGQQDPC